MKRSLIIFFSMLFVLSFTVAAFAEVTISGDARVRGIWQSEYDLDGNIDQDDRYYDQLIGLDITGKAGDAEVRVRVETVDITSGEDRVWGENAIDLFFVDTAYLHVPVAVGANTFVIDAGLMTRPVGNMFYQGDDHYVEGIEVSSRFGNAEVSVFTDKVDETRDTAVGDENLEDNNNYGATLSTNVGDIKVGGILTYESDATTVTDDTGIEFAAFANGKAGQIAIAAEVAYKTGDLNEDPATGDNPMGGFVHAGYDVNEQLSVGGSVCYATNTFEASEYFTPTTMVGAADGDNPLALLDVFGAASDTTSIGVVGSVGFDVSDALSVMGRVGYLMLQDQGVGGEDATAIEVDAGLAYEIAENVGYKLDVAYLSPSDFSVEDDAAMGIAHSIEISF